MSRPVSSMGVKTNGGDWRNRSLSPNGNNNINKIKRSVSPIPDSPSNISDNGSTRQAKYTRRPLSSNSSTGAGQTVAALQQHHKRLMQQQQQHQDNMDSRRLRSGSPGYRSVSPVPKFSKSSSTENMATKQKQQPSQMFSNTNDDEVIFDDDDVIEGECEGDDIEEERMVVIQDTRSRSPSINISSGGSIMSVQQAPPFYQLPHTAPQEFKVVKEGWLFRKSVMQWKPVYAVAKHGNAVRPGGLYLYKDPKCTSHIHTYDMSEVLEISPRSKDFKQGIKWEILMRVKRENVLLGTEDPQARKDWIDSLTSIMGKVSIATQNELTSRINSSEQMNRDLQEIAEELDSENAQLKEQILILKDNLAKKDRFYQQELQSRDNELKETIAKKERLFQQELQGREEELNTEMDRQRQAMEQKCEIFEREAMQWRNRFSESEKRSTILEDYADNEEKCRIKIESLEMEVRKWRNRADDLERQNQKKEYRNLSDENYNPRNASFENNNGVKELLTDVKFNLQLLKDNFKSSSEETHTSIKTSIDNLYKTLEAAKLGWAELQGDIVKFLDGEKEESASKDAEQKNVMETLRSEFSELREEFFGVTSDDNDKKEHNLPSLSEKFDILLQMVENVQIGQSRLSSAIIENNSATDSSDDDTPTTPVLSAVDKDSELYKVIMDQQQQISNWIKESREKYNCTLSMIESSIKPNRSLPPVPAESSQKLTKVVENAMESIGQKQQQSQEEQAKQIKVIGNLLKLISDDIQSSSIPDLAALSQQLEDVVERLSITEERLSTLNHASNRTQDNAVSYRNMPAIDLNDADKSSHLFGFIQNTERLMDRTLKVLNRHDGMEESIRRAVKGVSKDQLEEILNIQQQNKEERSSIEIKMQRYEENARIYFEKSIDKVHTDLHEFSGVMYEMLKELVVQALEHSPSVEGEPRKVPIENMIELHGKLSGLNLALESEIAKLQEEKVTLESSVKKLQKTNKDLERQVDKRYEELRSIQDEYERVNDDVKRARQESTMNLARELEPLISQITRLKKLVPSSDVFSEINYEGGDINNSNQTRSKSPIPSRERRYEEGEEKDTTVNNKLRFPNMMNNRNRRNSYSSEFSESNEIGYNQEAVKSPLMGSRDRPRIKNPSFLGRK